MIVTTEYRDLETPTGVMRTHLYRPPERGSLKSYPGLLLYPEIFQQTGPIARLATQFASHGYVVMAPEIYHEHEPPGTVLPYDNEGRDRGNAYKYSTKLSTFDDDATVVVDALRAHPLCNGRIGSVGFCIGGHLAFRAALRPDILAACCMYPTDLDSGAIGSGRNADTLDRAGEIRGELARHPRPSGSARSISGAGDRSTEALSEASVRFSWHEVNAEHAFMRDEGPRYDAEASRLAMMIALGLFARVL